MECTTHSNAIDIFDKLEYTDEDIIEETKKHQRLNLYQFYYYLGLAYFEKERAEDAIRWYKRGEEIKD